MKSVREAAEYRRSVRDFIPDGPMDTEVVKRCIETATLAPNSSNMQLWEFYHVVSKDKLVQLAKVCFNQKAARTAQQMVIFVVRKDLYRKRAQSNFEFDKKHIPEYSPADKVEKRLKRKKAYYTKLMPFLYANYLGTVGLLRAGVVSVLSLFRPIYREVSNADMRTVAHKSAALAAQTFMLAMAAEGYDTCPMEGLDSKRAKRILKLPAGADINMIIACGIRKGEEGIYGKRFRVPFDEVYKKI